MKTLLTLVRHGETDWNALGRIQGQIDIALNENGLWQARQLASTLAAEPFDAVWSSDLLRTRQTVAPVLASRAIAPTWEPRLRERHFGRAQGMSREQIRLANPADGDLLESRDPDHDFGDGESLRRFHARCTEVLQEIVVACSGQSVLVVAHGGVLDSFYRAMSDIDLQAPRRWGLHNAALNRARVVSSEPLRFELLAWDDTAHLEQPRDEV